MPSSGGRTMVLPPWLLPPRRRPGFPSEGFSRGWDAIARPSASTRSVRALLYPA